MTDYQITLPDGTTVEAPDAYETVSMALAMQDSGMEIELFTDRDLKDTTTHPQSPTKRDIESITQRLTRRENERPR